MGNKKIPISLCMIAKNEESFLGGALGSVRSVLGLGDLVVVDTGSTDRTKEIALEHGARVFDFEWCDDFSAPRNYAAEKAANDWILALDADEEIARADLGELMRFIADPHAIGQIAMVEMSDNERHDISRLYNRSNYAFEGSIHEQIAPRHGKRAKRKEAPILTIHHGYLPEVKQVKGKLERNERLLVKELEQHPGDPYLLFQLGKNYFTGGDLQNACSCFEKALSSNPGAQLDYIYRTVECLGYALINTGQYDKALKLRERYADKYKTIPQFRFLSAHIYQNNGMLIEAVECYESCIGADIADYKGITSYLSYYNIGVILECVGMAEDAIEMYKNCGDYEPAKMRLDELRGSAEMEN